MLVGLNIYNLYSECYHPERHLVDETDTNTTVISVTDLWLWNSLRKKRVVSMLKRHGNVKVIIPCVNTTALTTYMNDVRVRRALHIPDDLPVWEVCRSVGAPDFLSKLFLTVCYPFNTVEGVPIKSTVEA